MSYREAVLQGTPEEFYPEVWAHGGEIFDPELGVHLLGSYNKAREALGGKGYLADASIIPWWLNSQTEDGQKNPAIAVNPEVFDALGPFFGYPGAIVSQDGSKHRQLRTHVSSAIHKVGQDTETIDRIIETRLLKLDEMARPVGSVALDGVGPQVVDLQAAFIRPAALDLLAHRLGLPDDMKAEVHASTEAQAQFTWPHTPPPYEDQPGMARDLVGMLEYCKELVATYNGMSDEQLPKDITGHLVRAGREGHMQEHEVVANLFGLVHAGYITSAGTITRLTDALLRSGRWSALDPDSPIFAQQVEDGMNEYTSVHGWMRRKGGPDGPHAIVLIEAANQAPDRQEGKPLTFSPLGPHRCLGEADAINTGIAMIGGLRRALGDIRPYGNPERTTDLAFREQSDLTVALVR
jgi:cytochrome P450